MKALSATTFRAVREEAKRIGARNPRQLLEHPNTRGCAYRKIPARFQSDLATFCERLVRIATRMVLRVTSRSQYDELVYLVHPFLRSLQRVLARIEYYSTKQATNDRTTWSRRINESLSVLHGVRVPRVAAYPRRRSVRHLLARLNQRERERISTSIAVVSRFGHLAQSIDVELADARVSSRRRQRADAVAAIEKSARFLSPSLISRTLRRVIRAVLGAFESAMSRDRIDRTRSRRSLSRYDPFFFFSRLTSARQDRSVISPLCSFSKLGRDNCIL